MTDKEKTRAEIEKAYNEAQNRIKLVKDEYWEGKVDSYRNVLCIFDSMQEEQVSKEWVEELMAKLDSLSKEDFKKVFDKYAVDFNEEPVSEDLEQAIDTYLASYFGGEKEKQDWPFLKKMAIHFAKWQKEQFDGRNYKKNVKLLKAEENG